MSFISIESPKASEVVVVVCVFLTFLKLTTMLTFTCNDCDCVL